MPGQFLAARSDGAHHVPLDPEEWLRRRRARLGTRVPGEACLATSWRRGLAAATAFPGGSAHRVPRAAAPTAFRGPLRQPRFVGRGVVTSPACTRAAVLVHRAERPIQRKGTRLLEEASVVLPVRRPPRPHQPRMLTAEPDDGKGFVQYLPGPNPFPHPPRPQDTVAAQVRGEGSTMEADLEAAEKKLKDTVRSYPVTPKNIKKVSKAVTYLKGLKVFVGLGPDHQNAQIVGCPVSGSREIKAGGIFELSDKLCPATPADPEWLTLKKNEVDARWSKLKISGEDNGFQSPAKKRDPMDKDTTSSPVSTLAHALLVASSCLGATIQVQEVWGPGHGVKALQKRVAVVTFAFCPTPPDACVMIKKGF